MRKVRFGFAKPASWDSLHAVFYKTVERCLKRAAAFGLAFAMLAFSLPTTLAATTGTGGDPVGAVMDRIKAGDPARAVGLADRIIADYDAKMAQEPRRKVYCGGGDKAIHVLLEAAIRREDAAVYPQALCDAHFLKGFALIDMGRGDLAEAELRRATELDPFEPHYVNEYAELFKSRREWQKSYDLFAHAWDIVAKDKSGPDALIAARALRGMGYNKVEMGQFNEAEHLFRQSQEYEPDSAAAHAELAFIARKLAIGS
jgi:tetratricopeptide (TPR) repeat protein